MRVSIYLAGKMTGLSEKEMRGWRIKASSVLEGHGFDILDPTSVDLGKEPSPGDIVSSNKFMINRSDLLLAELDFEEVSIGTVGEIVYAVEKGKPIVAWGGAERIVTNPWILANTTRIFDGLNEALEYVIRSYSLYKETEIVGKRLWV
jgi:nucleoside 2-deoxyribosyltransferase